MQPLLKEIKELRNSIESQPTESFSAEFRKGMIDTILHTQTKRNIVIKNQYRK
jgi:hypothetical protein